MRNKYDLTNDKHEMWIEMTRQIILPNNRNIVKLLEDNVDILNDTDMNILKSFRLHIEGFEANQKSVNKKAEYPLFPKEIYDILTK